MPKRNLIWVVAIVAAAGVTLLVTRGRRQQIGGDGDHAQFEPVVQTYRKIKDNYYRPVAQDKLLRGAVRGMVGALGEFSSYVPPGKVDAFSHRVSGRVTGLGLRVGRRGGEVVVIGPLPDSPAHRAGLLAGDRILAIDARPLTGLDPGQVAELLDGPIGTSVELVITREGSEGRTVELTRSEFPIETVEGLYRNSAGEWVHLLDPDGRIAYIRIKEFVSDSPERLRRVFRRLPGLRAAVLDLRGNPGGLPAAAIGLANMFLRTGLIVTFIDKDGRRQRHVAHADGTYPDDLLVAVLINADTASAAEIVAGALKLHGRAVLVGTRTRGKGCVQSMISLPGKLGQINLTSSEFLLGADVPVMRRPGSDEWGVDPHEQVLLLPSCREMLSRLRAEAEVLPPPRPPTAPTATPGRADIVKKLLRLDTQLSRAYKLLRRPREMQLLIKRAAAQRARKRAAARRSVTSGAPIEAPLPESPDADRGRPSGR